MPNEDLSPIVNNDSPFDPFSNKQVVQLKKSQPKPTVGYINALHICGLTEGVKFEFPEIRKQNPKVLANRSLVEIQSNVGFAVYSFKMIFNDGETP